MMSVNSDTDMDKAIYNGFKSFIPDLKLLLCVYHLEKISDMNHEKDASKSLLKDIYGYRYGGIHEVGLADAADEIDFLVKVETLKPKWEKLCPGFHNWFLTKRKDIFVVSVIESARKN